MIRLPYWLLQCISKILYLTERYSIYGISGLLVPRSLVVSLERQVLVSYIIVSSIRRDALNWFPDVRNIPGKPGHFRLNPL